LRSFAATTIAVEREASSVDGVRTTSTSGITATGLKKWNPTTRSGCLRRAPMLHGQRRGIGREDRRLRDVLLDLGENCLLRPELFEDGLDHPVAVREVSLRHRPGDERLEAVVLV